MGALTGPAARASGALLPVGALQRAVTGPAAKAAIDPADIAYHAIHALLSSILRPYWAINPTASQIVSILDAAHGPNCVPFDHFAFRTFGVEGLGIGSVSRLLTDYGYEPRDELEFAAKKLDARWYAAPHPSLPRVFVSEIRVAELSPAAREVVERYVGAGARHIPAGHGPLLAAAGALPWPTPTAGDYDLLAAESEYAAWVLAHGYALNHTTVSVHGLPGSPDIAELNDDLQAAGFRLSAEGGVTKVSPEGLLRQSSTAADRVPYAFACGVIKMVPAAYIEFAERLPLPEFENVPKEQLEEKHRRDGFESSNADKIFESTSRAVVG